MAKSKQRKSTRLRHFSGGAVRDNNDNKLDYSGFLSPHVLERFAQYMDKHRSLPDGSRRRADNWKSGIPLESYRESLVRHTVDWWKAYDSEDWETADELACAIMFNVQGYILERLREQGNVK